jgi:glycine cleavage system H lipoate-binding protein
MEQPAAVVSARRVIAVAEDDEATASVSAPPVHRVVSGTAQPVPEHVEVSPRELNLKSIAKSWLLEAEKMQSGLDMQYSSSPSRSMRSLLAALADDESASTKAPPTR